MDRELGSPIAGKGLKWGVGVFPPVDEKESGSHITGKGSRVEVKA